MFKYYQGSLMPRQPQKNIIEPRVISYTHVIRKLNLTQCNCKQEIDRISKQYQVRLRSKDGQIQALVNRIVLKQYQIQGLQKEIDKWKLKVDQYIVKSKQKQNHQNHSIITSLKQNFLRDITNFNVNTNANLNKIQKQISEKKFDQNQMNFIWNKASNNININEFKSIQNNEFKSIQNNEYEQKLNNSLNSTITSLYFYDQNSININNNSIKSKANNNNNKMVQNYRLFSQPNSAIRTTNSSYSKCWIEQQVELCFDKTNLIMDQIEGLMKKKNKYQFYNRFNPGNHADIENSIIEELENGEEKSDDDTRDGMGVDVMDPIFVQQIDLFNNRNIKTNNTNNIINNYENQHYNDDYVQNDSLEITNYKSVNNLDQVNQQGFYQKMLNDTISLKHTIIQMKEESMKEISQIEKYYQDKLKLIVQELQIEKEKNKSNKNDLVILEKQEKNQCG